MENSPQGKLGRILGDVKSQPVGKPSTHSVLLLQAQAKRWLGKANSAPKKLCLTLQHSYNTDRTQLPLQGEDKAVVHALRAAGSYCILVTHAEVSTLFLALPHSPTISNLPSRLCSTKTSALERERARAHQIGETK